MNESNVTKGSHIKTVFQIWVLYKKDWMIKKFFMIFVRPEYDPVDRKRWTVSVKMGDIESPGKG